MTQTKVAIASRKAHVLDAETQAVLASVKHKNGLAIGAFIVCWSALLLVGIIGIYRQNQIAQTNKEHIDCIVKLLATPIPADKQHKIITDATNSCGILFTE